MRALIITYQQIKDTTNIDLIKLKVCLPRKFYISRFKTSLQFTLFSIFGSSASLFDQNFEKEGMIFDLDSPRYSSFKQHDMNSRIALILKADDPVLSFLLLKDSIKFENIPYPQRDSNDLYKTLFSKASQL